MRKTIIPLFTYLLFPSLLAAQGKEGNVWVLGYPPNPGFERPYLGGSLIKFGDGGIDTSQFAALRSMVSSSSIADKNGSLLFYSNGCDILNRNHEIMSNGENINNVVGGLYDLYCVNEPRAYGELQDMLILPFPKHNDLYTLIHIRYPVSGQAISQMKQSTVDMSLDGGLGGVVEKNEALFDERITNGYMTATRHGNGLDWWITVPEWHKTQKLVFLLDSLGLHGPEIQEGAGLLTGSGGYGQAAFSPDGTKYAEICFFQGQVLDFDRCSGKFSNPRVINYDSTGGNNYAGVAFSPNSRYMYISRSDSLYQFDMNASNFNDSRLTVAQYDGMPDSTFMKGSDFYTLLTAPDDKIYICPLQSKALHIIHQPNERGALCGFQKWGLELPTIHYGQLPNLPNFKLGAMDPPCNSMGCDTLPQTEDFFLFPNPATDYVVISNKKSTLGGALTFQLYDALGRLLIEETLDCLPHRIELADLPQAGYFYRVFSADSKRLTSGTLVKMSKN